jgi:hypothetical protein
MSTFPGAMSKEWADKLARHAELMMRAHEHGWSRLSQPDGQGREVWRMADHVYLAFRDDDEFEHALENDAERYRSARALVWESP